MTDIEQKALALVNEVRAQFSARQIDNLDDAMSWEAVDALVRAIQQHEADKQRFSEAAAGYVAETKRCCGDWWAAKTEAFFSRFIIAKPDPLVEECRRIAEHLLALNAPPASDEDTIALMVKAMLKAPSAIVKKEPGQ